MKKKFKSLTKCTLIVLTLMSCSTTYAQISDVGLFVSGGTSDASKILGAYVKPFTNAFGYNLNAGWYNTAKVHSLLGFDFTLTFNVAFIPSEAKTFDLKGLDLSSSASIPSPSIAQSIAGKTSVGPEISYITGGNTIVSYKTPGGVNLGFVPIPMMQLGIGLVKGTEIIGRFMPSISLGNGGNNKIGMWGIGLKHSIKQWIPAIDDLPFLNISVIAGYSRLHMVNHISFDPNNPLLYPDNSISFSDTVRSMDYSGQQLDLMVKSFTASAIVSLDIPVITLYGGIGFSSTNTDLKLLGKYPIPNLNRTDVYVGDIKSDPISIALKGGTKPRLNIGFKLKMGIIAFNVDYTYANYSITTVGFGVGFR